jgi:hypothetical protein
MVFLPGIASTVSRHPCVRKAGDIVFAPSFMLMSYMLSGLRRWTCSSRQARW